MPKWSTSGATQPATWSTPCVPEFDGAHGKQLPSVSFGIAGQHCTFVLAGPGVKEGLALQGQVRVVDVAPTLCYLLGLPMPRNVEGGVVYEALTDPDLAPQEVKQLWGGGCPGFLPSSPPPINRSFTFVHQAICGSHVNLNRAGPRHHARRIRYALDVLRAPSRHFADRSFLLLQYSS